MLKLSQDGSAELSEIFTQFDAESFEKALLSIGRVATTLGKFAIVMIDNKGYNEKVDFTHLKETKKGLVAAVRDCAMACTDVHACLECACNASQERLEEETVGTLKKLLHHVISMV